MKLTRSEIARCAEENRPLLDGTTTAVQRILVTNHVVFGVWDDPNEPDGIDYMIIKGKWTVKRFADGTTPAKVKFSAIPCDCAEEAEMARRIFGDGTVH
jgi:hypothetical protein